MFVNLERTYNGGIGGFDVQRIVMIEDLRPGQTNLVYEMDGGTRNIGIAESPTTVTDKVNAVWAQMLQAGRPRLPTTPRRLRTAGRGPAL